MNQATAFNYAYTVMLSLIKEIQERSDASTAEAAWVASTLIVALPALLNDEGIAQLLQDVRLDPPPEEDIKNLSVKEIHEVFKASIRK